MLNTFVNAKHVHFIRVLIFHYDENSHSFFWVMTSSIQVGYYQLYKYDPQKETVITPKYL
jgi:hypothetical protein